jgi:sarcosine oxidase, subunit beta
MPERFDVAIVGAGLYGCALAFHLACDKASRVLLLERRDAPTYPSGTDTSAGILTLQGWDPWDISLVRESCAEYTRLAEREGEPGPRANGGLRVARSEEGARWLEKVARVLTREGVEARQISAPELQDLEPFAQVEDLRLGLLTPADSVVSPAALRSAYLRAARRAGCEIRAVDPNEPIPTDADGRWRWGGPGATEADHLVVAAGAGTKRRLASLGYSAPLAPFEAQAIRCRPRPLLGEFPTLHDLDFGLYARPDGSGRILAGDGTGTREADPERWSAYADPAFVGRMTGTLRELFGALGELRPESAWKGLCVASPDRYPLVGRAPGSPNLYLASGFNGFGTMRAGALARRLAEGLCDGRWDGLRPADPARFAGAPSPFEPRPEFPLEGEEGPPASMPRPAPAPEGEPSHAGWAEPAVAIRSLGSPSDLNALRWTSLSDWFDPFLPQFARDSLRAGGRVEVAEEEGLVRGLRLAGPSEEVASAFTRQRRLAEHYLAGADETGVYLEQPWQPGGEPVEIFAADARDWVPGAPLRNRVRIAQPEDLPAVKELMRAELGAGVERWFATLPRPEETAFIGETAGRMVGVSWLTRVGSYARGHSFVVHPRFRGLGVGTDLLTARMLWLQRTGGRLVVSEIYDGNLASRAATERAGMAPVGRMYHFRDRSRSGKGATTSGAHRTGGTRSPSSR